MTKDTIILSTAWLDQPALGQRPARTLLVGAATLSVRQRFGRPGFDLQADSTTVADNPADTMAWLTERLSSLSRLLLWRAEDIVVPSLIAAAETARDTLAGTKLLRQLEGAFTGEVVDVADAYGGSAAKSFDAIAHTHGLSFVPMTKVDLAEAHRTGNHGAIRLHLAERAKAMWQLWLRERDDIDELIAATDAWLATSDAEVRL